MNDLYDMGFDLTIVIKSKTDWLIGIKYKLKLISIGDKSLYRRGIGHDSDMSRRQPHFRGNGGWITKISIVNKRLEYKK